MHDEKGSEDITKHVSICDDPEILNFNQNDPPAMISEKSFKNLKSILSDYNFSERKGETKNKLNPNCENNAVPKIPSDNNAMNFKIDESLPVNTSTDNNLPYIEATINENKFNCLIDTGSSANIINHKVLNLLGNIKIKPTDIHLCGINRSPVKVIGEIVVQLKILDIICNVDVIIAEITADLVLGNPFIREFGAQLNLKEKQMTIPGLRCTTIPINKVESSQNEKEILSTPQTVAACVKNESIKPHHAMWIEFHPSTKEEGYIHLANNPDVIVYLECDSVQLPAQRTTYNSDNGTYSLLYFNRSDDYLNLDEGQILGHIQSEINHAHLEFEFQDTTGSNNDSDSANSSYVLELTKAEREARWRELCRVLKVDEWEITSEEKEQAFLRLKEYEFVFALENEPLSIMHDYLHQIDIGDTKPISQRPRHLTEKKQQELNKLIDDLIARGLIRPSRSPWSSPVVLVKKSSNPNSSDSSSSSTNSWRLCIDYRRLNDCIVKDSFPLPNINHVLGTMKHSNYFTTVDLHSGFHQLKIRESDIPITAFCTPDGLYEWLVTPMGLTNSPPSFVRALTKAMTISKKRACLYFDDILIFGITFSSHLENLIEVLKILMSSGLKLKASKCTCFARKIQFLGHLITQDGISCSPNKIECIKNIPIPKDPKSLRSYLGMFSYYRKFVKDYSKIASKLFKLAVCDKKDFVWDGEAEKSFLELKNRLISSPILTLPRESDSYILTTDASGTAIGSVLTVDRPEGRKVIAYASHVLEKSRQSYGATKKEFYAIVFYVQYFRRYLKIGPFTIETDHKCLKFISTFKDPPALIARWIAILAEYHYTLVHKPGTNGIIKVADALSRPAEINDEMPIASFPDDNSLTPQDYIAQENNQPEPKFDLEVDESRKNVESINTITFDTEHQQKFTPLRTQIDTSRLTTSPVVVDNTYTIHKQFVPISDNTVKNSAESENSATNQILPRTSNNDYFGSSNIVHAQNIEGDGENTQIEDENGEKFDDFLPEIDKSRQEEVLKRYIHEISSAQTKDSDIKILKLRFLQNPSHTVHQISSDPPLVKFYWSHKNRLKMENDILYYIDTKNVARIIVPRHKIPDLLQLVHDDKMSGHRSSCKMLPILKSKYHWFKMKDDVNLYCKRCVSCGAHKKPRANRPRAPLFMTRVSSKFERLSVDFAGPFEKTKRGNKFIFLGVCCFTKFGFCFPLPSTESLCVARVLIERWIIYFGCPLEIHSDRGSNLISELIKQLYKLLNIKHSCSLSYVPQQNGAAEKFVSTMKNMMCHFAVSKPREWDDLCPLVVLAYNNQISAATKCTPQQMAMGESARVSLDLAWGAPPIVEDLEEQEYVAWLRETMHEIHDYALKTMAHTIQTTKDRFDKGQFGKPYQKDDLVWKLKGKFESGSRKFQRRYEGIYIVLEKKSNTSYHIKHLKTHVEEIVHFNRLKKAFLDPIILDSFLHDLYPLPNDQNHEHIDVEDETIVIGVRAPRANFPQPARAQPLPNLQQPQVVNADPVIVPQHQPEQIVEQPQQPQADPPLPPRRRALAIPVRGYNLRSRTCNYCLTLTSRRI